MIGFLVASAVLIWTLATASMVGGAASAEITPSLIVNPGTAVPNQRVVLYGAGFTPASTPGGAGYLDGHQITGIGTSNIKVDGILLTASSVGYPITFDSIGSWAAAIAIPGPQDIAAGSTVTITVVDDQGQTLSTQLTILSSSISVDPASGSQNTEMRITGKGFPASTISASIQISLSYAGLPFGVVSPNSSGEIDITLPVPMTASAGSANQVRATRVGYINQFATSTHSVPQASITLSPASGMSGSTVTITGENFPAYSAVSDARVREIPVLESTTQRTDKDGRFASTIFVPLFAPGVQTISATVRDVTADAPFTVSLEPAEAPPATTLPSAVEIPQTVETAPAIAPAQAMEPLIQDENLVRVWNFDNETKTWTFFDPRPAFADANTLKNMVTGQVYWLRVNSVQLAALNGNQVALYQGWNLVPW